MGRWVVAPLGSLGASWREEASGHLVGPAAFKADEGASRSLAGSIPVRLRHTRPRDLQPELERLLATSDRAGAEAEVLRLVADHVGQMTDDRASRLRRRLTGHVDRGFSDFM